MTEAGHSALLLWSLMEPGARAPLMGVSAMPDPDQDTYVAEAIKMNDDELMDTWETASDQERKNPSPLLKAVEDEMRARNIPR